MHTIIISVSWNYFFQVKISNLFPSLFPHRVSIAKTQTTRQLKTASHSFAQELPLPYLLPLATRNTNGSMLINASATQTRLKSTTQPVMGIETKGGIGGVYPEILMELLVANTHSPTWISQVAGTTVPKTMGTTQFFLGGASFRHGIFHSIKLQSKAVFANCSLQSLKSSF